MVRFLPNLRLRILRQFRSNNASIHVSSSGTTLIEVLIATAVVVLVLVALSSTMAVVLRNQRDSANQQQATKYGQEAVEWMRKFRDTVGWTTFYQTVSPGSPVSKCMLAAPLTTDVAGYQNTTYIKNAACGATDYITGDTNNFQRNITITSAGGNDVIVVAVVSWNDGPTRTLSASTTLELRQWN
jgi:Tfp pilus assembly protein PilV